MSRLIVLEGLDGSGKSTQLERLPTALRERGIDIRTISFPDYDDPSSTLVRMYLAGEFGSGPSDVNAYAASSFYAVDRYASYVRHWKTDYESGRLILAARYVSSNAIHQAAKLPPDEWETYLDWLYQYEFEKMGIPRPDLTLYLDMPEQVSDQLLSNRYGGDETKRDIHEKDKEYLRACRAAAAFAAKRLGWETVPCAKDGRPFPPEVITGRLVEKIESVVKE